MTLRQIGKRVLPPIIVDLIRGSSNNDPLKDPIETYLSGGQVPWSPGYTEFARQFIADILQDDSLLDRFRLSDPLPAGYGIGIHERCIEYPWLLANLEKRPSLLLDAGSVLNYDYLLDHALLRNKRLHILTLAPEDQCFWQRGISYLFDDLREIPIRDGYYDIIVCISTLEHVGCDNTFFSRREIDRENSPDDFLQVVYEFRRVLKPNGQLYLSVPFGVYRHFGLFQQFDSKQLHRAVEAFGKSKQTTRYYRYSSNGWNLATENECSDCEYVEWIARAWAYREYPSPLPVEKDRAAAARAVACVRLIKA